MSLQGAEGRDLRQAGARDLRAVEGDVAQPDLGVEPAHRLDEQGRGPRVQPVRRPHREHPVRLPLLPRRGVRCGCAVVRLVLTQMTRLRGEGVPRLGGDVGRGGPARGGHRGDDEALDQRRRTEHRALADVVVDQFEGELGGEHRAAQVHQHHHAVTVVGAPQRLADRHRVGAERAVVEPGGDLDRDAAPGQHLPRQGPRRLAEGPAVGDHDEPDGHDGSCSPRAVAAAATSRAVEVAPGSWWPALRSPR